MGSILGNTALAVHTLVGICLAMQLLAGHAQIAWHTLLLTVLWVVFWAWQLLLNERPLAHVLYRVSRLAHDLLRLMLAVLLAFGLAAIQLLPTTEYLLRSQHNFFDLPETGKIIHFASELVPAV